MEARDKALYLTYKARIYPNSEQRRAIAASIENNRYVHNPMITCCRLHLDGYGRLPSRNDLVRFGTLIWKRCPSFHDMYRNSMNETARRVLISYKRCLEKARARGSEKNVSYMLRMRTHREEGPRHEGAQLPRLRPRHGSRRQRGDKHP